MILKFIKKHYLKIIILSMIIMITISGILTYKRDALAIEAINKSRANIVKVNHNYTSDMIKLHFDGNDKSVQKRWVDNAHVLSENINIYMELINKHKSNENVEMMNELQKSCTTPIFPSPTIVHLSPNLFVNIDQYIMHLYTHHIKNCKDFIDALETKKSVIVPIVRE